MMRDFTNLEHHLNLKNFLSFYFIQFLTANLIAFDFDYRYLHDRKKHLTNRNANASQFDKLSDKFSEQV